MTSVMVLKMRRVMVINELMGFTRVAMLGKIGVRREDDVWDEL